MVKGKEQHYDFQDMRGLMDTHAHLSMLKKRGLLLEDYLSRLFAAGFGGVIDVGVDAGDLPARIRAVGGSKFVRFSAGIWPSTRAITDRTRQTARLERDIRAAPVGYVVALGECGLDRHHHKPGSPECPGERELFETQLDLARRLDLPVIIHSREAPVETLDAIRRHPDVRGVIHCFSYGPLEARKFLDAGYYLSFAGTLTYKSAQAIRDALLVTPLDRLFFETDSPYLAPLPFRGELARPDMVGETYRTAGELLRMKPEALRERVAQNLPGGFKWPVERPIRSGEAGIP